MAAERDPQEVAAHLVLCTRWVHSRQDKADTRGEGGVALPPACQALLAGALQRRNAEWSASRDSQRGDIAVL